VSAPDNEPGRLAGQDIHGDPGSSVSRERVDTSADSPLPLAPHAGEILARGAAGPSSGRTSVGRTAAVRGARSRGEAVQARFRFHDIRVLVDSAREELVASLRKDFSYFADDSEGEVDIRLELVEGTPPWREIPQGKKPLFRTPTSTVYRSRGRRIVDHGKKALVFYDLQKDEGIAYAENPRHLEEVAYILLLSRIGHHLDLRGFHRCHAAGLTIAGKSLLFLASSGCGKTTLALSLLQHEGVRFLSDEIPLLGGDGLVHPLPLPPRLTADSPVPAPFTAADLEPVHRSKQPPKVKLPVSALRSRISGPCPLAGIFVLGRDPEGPSIRRLGRVAGLRALWAGSIYGRDFPQTKAYYLELTPYYAFRMARVFWSRIKRFVGAQARAPVHALSLGPDLETNRTVLLDYLREELGLDAGSVETTRLRSPIEGRQESAR